MVTEAQTATSLRTRLFIRIVAPLVILALLLGFWRASAAFSTAQDVFDRNLTAVAIAIARDVAGNEGELISLETSKLLDEAGGGKVFYHVAGPDNAYVSGFGNPPTRPVDLVTGVQNPTLFHSTHSGEPVRVARLSQFVRSDSIVGSAQISVWQKMEIRESFARRQGLLSIGVIALMLGAVMLLVWFGVNWGLAPLIGLRNAIKKRNPKDLRPINRSVPEEVVPLVNNLNDLFGAVQSSIDARERLIANAAHQLRNPISAVQAQAEAALAARSEKEMHRRLSKTVAEAKHASDLAEQLLLLEKLSLANDVLASQKIDLNKTVLVSITRLADRILDRGIEFSFDPWDKEIFIDGDPVLIQEIIANLVENAAKHGGSTLSKISVSVAPEQGSAVLLVEDDGKGISEENHELVFERFAQVDHGPGSGLGLAIVAEITRCHGGTVSVEPAASGSGVRFRVVLPLFENRMAPQSSL